MNYLRWIWGTVILDLDLSTDRNGGHVIIKIEIMGDNTITVFLFSKGSYEIRLRSTVQGFQRRSIYPKVNTSFLDKYPEEDLVLCVPFSLTD